MIDLLLQSGMQKTRLIQSHYILLVLFFLPIMISAQNTFRSPFISPATEKIIIMQPTGEMINDLPEMVIVSDTSILHKTVMDIVMNSFMNEAIDLYYLAATYLYNKSQTPAIEPAYLALSQNQGGFAKRGFCIKTENGIKEKADVPYIDIVESRMNVKTDRLMSITQLYPHEMGHVIYGMLNPPNGNDQSKSSDMHFFSVKTDYSTAFNEGFAEHIENVSRIFEKNETIKQGIFEDIESIRRSSKFSIKGFEKDYNYPIRMGFYKMTMPFWYQKYENLKRYDHVMDGYAKYLNATPDLGNVEDRLTIRNAGIRPDTNELRNYVQMLCTEGVISTFFTRLTLSKLADQFLDTSFYKPFLSDKSHDLSSPEQIFSSVQNQFLKYYTVFNEHMRIEGSGTPAFVSFVEGYIKAFPSEEQAVKGIFKEVTQLDYTKKVPEEIWLLVKDHSHRRIVQDPYGAMLLPFYTFELNAAETDDLLVLKGVSKNEALRIIEHRKTNGFYKNLEQIKEVKGVSKASVELILNSRYNREYIDQLSLPKLNFMSLITASLKHLFLYVMAYFVFITGLVYFFSLRRKNMSNKKIISILLVYFLQWITFVLCGLTSVIFFDYPWQILILLSVLFGLINLFQNRKNKEKRHRSLFATSVMCVLLLVSLV